MEVPVQISMDSQIVMPALTQALEDQALRVYRSFDLRTAISVLPDCSCPHHGTDQCTCQYTVLLVYGDAPSPVLLVAHGRDGQTWLSVSAAKQSSTSLQQKVRPTPPFPLSDRLIARRTSGRQR